MTLLEARAETFIVEGPAEGFTRVRMTVAYDGSRFRGMAENRGVVTVAGSIRDALERVVGHAAPLVVAGRTDAGVHAWGQVVHFDVATEAMLDGRAAPERLARAVNRQCVPAIVVRDAQVAPDGFHARFSAHTRRYRYTVLNRDVPDPFIAHTSWWVPQPLDVRAMILGCDALIGLHDFSSFCRRPANDPEASLIRRVIDCRWHELGDGVLRFDIEANAFCHQMVRSIVGTLVDMGRGRLRAGQMTGIIRAADRQYAGQLAPPHGLCLWEVTY